MTVWTDEMKRAAMADAAKVCTQADVIEGLEVAIRAALSFVQERFSDQGTYSDGRAQMVAMALRGALARSKQLHE